MTSQWSDDLAAKLPRQTCPECSYSALVRPGFRMVHRSWGTHGIAVMGEAVKITEADDWRDSPQMDVWRGNERGPRRSVSSSKRPR